MPSVSSSQFDDSWSRPQAVSNPSDSYSGWNTDNVQTGKAHPADEGADSPLPWRAGANTAASRATAWQSPSGHTIPLPWSKESGNSLLMGGIGSS